MRRLYSQLTLPRGNGLIGQAHQGYLTCAIGPGIDHPFMREYQPNPTTRAAPACADMSRTALLSRPRERFA
jgi:hypothetical protein